MTEHTPSDKEMAGWVLVGALRVSGNPDGDLLWDAWLAAHDARVRRDAAREVGQYIERHHPDGLTEKTTVLGYIDTAADRMGRGIHANGRDRETP